jgi:hypothetical protein
MQFKWIIPLAALTLLVAACDFDDTGPLGNLNEIRSLIAEEAPPASPESGSTGQTESGWVITSFMEDGRDITGQFSGYRFRFFSDGQFRLVNPSDEVTLGSYRIFMDDGVQEFEISLPAGLPYHVRELDDDWYVEQITANRIALREYDEEKTERLIFEKQ